MKKYAVTILDFDYIEELGSDVYQSIHALIIEADNILDWISNYISINYDLTSEGLRIEKERELWDVSSYDGRTVIVVPYYLKGAYGGNTKYNVWEI